MVKECVPLCLMSTSSQENLANIRSKNLDSNFHGNRILFSWRAPGTKKFSKPSRAVGNFQVNYLHIIVGVWFGLDSRSYQNALGGERKPKLIQIDARRNSTRSVSSAASIAMVLLSVPFVIVSRTPGSVVRSKAREICTNCTPCKREKLILSI